MAKLTDAKRSRLSASTFAIPETRSYPIPDASHAREALARSSGKPEEARVKAAVKRKFPNMNIGGNVMGRLAASASAKGAKAGVNAKLNAGTPNLNEVA